MIRCGNCKKKHNTVAEIRECFEIGEEREPASQAQKNFAQMLLRERMPLAAYADNSTGFMENMIQEMSRSDASAFISAMREQAFKPRKALVAGVAEDISDGIYYNPKTNEIRKVYWNLGKTRLLLKRLVVEERVLVPNPTDGLPLSAEEEHSDNEYSSYWEYIGKANSSTLNGFEKMSREEAAKFGRLYGICARCGAVLNDEDSIARGIGPICAQKENW